MKRIFTPGKHLMAQMRFPAKFALVGVFAALPIVVCIYLLVSDLRAQSEFTRQERSGTEVIGALTPLLQKTQMHRGHAAALLSGSPDSAGSLALIETQLQAEIGLIDNVLARQASSFDVRADWTTLKTHLNDLNGRYRGMTAAASFEAHTNQVRETLDFMSTVADKSNLTLDPEVVSFYLMDSVVSQLPALAESAAQQRGVGMAVAARKKATLEENAYLTSLVGGARERLSSLAKNADKILAERKEMAALKTDVQEVRAANERLAKAVQTQILPSGGPTLSSSDYARVATESVDASYKLIDKILPLLVRELDLRLSGLQTRLAWIGTMVLMSAALAFYFALSFFFNMRSGLNKMVSVVTAVGNGDLTGKIQVKGRDEVADLMRAVDRMTNQLRSIVSVVRQSTEEITTAAGEIAVGNHDLSSRTEEQASSLQQTAATMEQLTGTVRQNADSAQEATKLAETASAVAEESGAAVERMAKTMSAIQASSRQIGDIISVIDGIAFQTNILALNAAVEAARAGEQGRGFAVVASEVRTLAQRSAQAAKEIKGLITDSVSEVDTGSRLMDEAGKTMHDAVAQVKRVSDLITRISAATIEQSTGIDQVNVAVGSIDETTQQNAALVEQSAAAATSLKDQALRLGDAVGVFKLAA